MIDIVLVCSGGVSTSMMVQRMKKAAEKHGVEINIIATGADEFVDEQMTCDILLVAPQISYQFDELVNDYSDSIKIIQMIDRKDYGEMNGEKVLLEVIEKLK